MGMGYCRYCGQGQAFDGNHDAQEQLNRDATENCQCKGARIARKKEEGYQRMRALIDENAEAKGFDPVSKEARECLLNLYALHAEGIFTKATINTAESWFNFAVGANGDGTVSVYRFKKTRIEA